MNLTFLVTAKLTKKARLKMELNQFAVQTETAIAGVLPHVVTGKIKGVRVMMTEFPRELIAPTFPALSGAGLQTKTKKAPASDQTGGHQINHEHTETNIAG